MNEISLERDAMQKDSSKAFERSAAQESLISMYKQQSDELDKELRKWHSAQIETQGKITDLEQRNAMTDADLNRMNEKCE